MHWAKLFVLVAGLAGLASASAADYVFADSFEAPVTCDGNGCTYCSPLNPDPVCGANSHCLPTQDSSSLCSYPAGSGTNGASCGSLADCAGPLACVDTGGPSATCRQWCQRPAGACPNGLTCVSFATPVFIGGVEWGVCL